MLLTKKGCLWQISTMLGIKPYFKYSRKYFNLKEGECFLSMTFISSLFSEELYMGKYDIQSINKHQCSLIYNIWLFMKTFYSFVWPARRADLFSANSSVYSLLTPAQILVKATRSATESVMGHKGGEEKPPPGEARSAFIGVVWCQDDGANGSNYTVATHLFLREDKYITKYR